MEINRDNKPVVRMGTNLLHCSDEILLHLFSFVTTADVFNLGQTCNRLHYLCKDRTLWVKADLRSKRMTLHELEFLKKFLLPDTRALCIRGYWKMTEYKDDWEFPASFLIEIREKCPNLQELAIENFVINPYEMPISSLPSTLTKLSFQETSLTRTVPPFSYFRDAEVHLPAIEVLILNGCKWMRPYTLMSISKCPHLRELYLNSVASFMSNVPYISLSCRFGFESLEVLDIRNTKLGDGEFNCFLFVRSLKKIHFECPCKDFNKEPKDLEGRMKNDYVKYILNNLLLDTDDSSDDDETPTVSLKPSRGILILQSIKGKIPNSEDCSEESFEGYKTNFKESGNTLELKRTMMSKSRERGNLALQSNDSTLDPQPSTSNETSTTSSSSNIQSGTTIDDDYVDNINIGNSSGTVVVAKDFTTIGSPAANDRQQISSNLSLISASSFTKYTASESNCYKDENKTYKRLSSDSETRQVTAVKRACSTQNFSDSSGIPSTSKVLIIEQQSEESLQCNHAELSNRNIISSPEESDEQPAQSGASGSRNVIFIDCSNTSNPTVSMENVAFNNVFLRNPKRYMRPNAQDFITNCSIKALLQSNGDIMMGEEEFKAYANLTDMSLRYFPCITDETLDLLKDLHTLKYLDVTGCSVTKEGISQLILNRPDLKVISGIELD